MIQQTTDWWSVGATLLGAALGAGIGAYGAYQASMRSVARSIRQEKLERIHSMALEANRNYSAHFAKVLHELIQDNEGEWQKYIKQHALYVAADVPDLHNQVSIYFPEQERRVSAMRDQLLDFGTACGFLAFSYCSPNEKAEYKKSISKTLHLLRDDFVQLRKAIENELRRLSK